MTLGEIVHKLLTFYKPFLKPAQNEVNQNARTIRCFNNIKDYNVGNIILGCGKGLLGAKIHWEILLNDVGFKIIKTKHVGADEKLAPEHHVLLIADRI